MPAQSRVLAVGLSSIAGVIVFSLAYFLGQDSADDDFESERKLLRDTIVAYEKKSDSLGKALVIANRATEVTRAASQEGRSTVVVVTPGLLSVSITGSNTPPKLVPVDSSITRSIVADRAHIDSLEKELGLTYERIASDSVIILTQKKENKLLEDRLKCEILWVIPCPSRKTATAIGAAGTAAAIATVKVLAGRSKK